MSLRLTCFAAFLFSLAACSSESAGSAADVGGPGDTDGGDTLVDAGGVADAGAEDVGVPGRIGDNQTIVGHSAAHVFWSGWDEGQNARQVDVRVEFPRADELFAGINMNFTLSCPNGRCDPWDRYGSFGVVTNPGEEDERYVELSRFITPFGVGGNWQVDVTDLRPLLTGPTTLRVFVDTWVGPGSSFGDGWQVDTTFDFYGGEPNPRVVAVLPIWDLARVAYGDPARPISEQLPPATVRVPEGASRLLLRTFVTGHGQGNALNCAEFCPQDHSFVVDGTQHTRRVWRDDCETTGAPGQRGTWQYPRAGWCPGAVTHDWTIDVGAAPAGREVEVAYAVSEYENTCRPDSASCSGCTLGNGCEWNDSNHTEPNFQVSALLIAVQ